MQVSIQTATSQHLKGIHELVQEWGYSASEPETLEWLKASTTSSNHQLFVALSDDSVVGWIAVEKRLSLGQGFISEITGLVVRSSHRRSGIGLLLVNAAEEWSRTLGLSRVLVRSNAVRLESHKFYPSIGFALTKTSKVYTKELNSPNRPRNADV